LLSSRKTLNTLTHVGRDPVSHPRRPGMQPRGSSVSSPSSRYAVEPGSSVPSPSSRYALGVTTSRFAQFVTRWLSGRERGSIGSDFGFLAFKVKTMYPRVHGSRLKCIPGRRRGNTKTTLERSHSGTTVILNLRGLWPQIPRDAKRANSPA
jgi:hypothetical protein